MSIYIRYLILILIITIPSLSQAQSPDKMFGKNRIQYRIFDWNYLSTPNYDIYFYKNGLENARLAAEIVEQDFDNITDIIGYSPYTKTKIFLYNNVANLQQSNIGINDQNYSGGGHTNFFKSQVEIAYPGNISDFKSELKYYVAKMLITDMMFGGNLKDMLQNAFLLTLPEWFMEGAALYVSQGWSPEMDDVIRDKFTRGKIKRLSTLKGSEAGLVGQSIWNFIAEKYGKINISNILNLTRIIRNEESSISSTLGLSFNRFVNEWRSFYQSMNEAVAQNYAEPVGKDRVRNKNRKGLLYNDVSINPSGERVAYSENRKGKYKVYLQRTGSGKKKVAFKGGRKVINQEIDEELPLVSWRDDRYLGIIGVKRARTYLWLYDANRGRKTKREIKTLSKVLDFDFSEDGNTIVLSANQAGHTDLFFYNVTNGYLQRITRDAYDDLNPKFIPGTEAIVFSSNRISDSLDNRKTSASKLDDNFNIFIYSPDTSKRVLRRVSNTISKEINPIPINSNEILYLSDQKGIYNIYKYKLDQNIFTQITKNSASIRDYDVNTEKGIIAYTAYYKNAPHLFVTKEFDANQNNFTLPTRRQEIIQARALSDRRLSRKDATTPDFISPTVNADTASAGTGAAEGEVSTNTSAVDTDSYTFEGEKQTKPTEEVAQAEKAPVDEIDTDDYQFESSPRKDVRTDTVRRSILRTYAVKPVKETKVQGPFPYQNRFSANNAVGTLVIDPLRGLGIKLEMEMTDMLENHKFYGGYTAFINFRSSSFFGEYQYLKNRVDFHAKVERNTYYIDKNREDFGQKYGLNKVEIGASYPFSLTSRISIAPFFANTNYDDVDLFSVQNSPPQQNYNTTNYGGFKAEFVFDNSLIGGLNIVEGTRFKIRFENFNGMFNDSNEGRGFNNLNVDLRKYFKIHKEIVLATRVNYGRFFGTEKQKYMLGGMSNWLNGNVPKSFPMNFSANVENTNIFFSEFVTPMRGFSFNKMNGEQVLAGSAELRFPIVSYFYKGPISSNFLRNLQFIGFFDIGSAWDGKPPFSNDNTIGVERKRFGPVKYTVKAFTNPWLTSYGAGMRTMLFGYFVKLDAAWGVENYIINKPKFYLTIGQDF